MKSRIKRLALDRAGPSDVIRLALPMSLTAFAQKHGFSKQEVSQCLSGYRPHEKIRDALAEELEASRDEINQILDSRNRSNPPGKAPGAEVGAQKVA